MTVSYYRTGLEVAVNTFTTKIQSFPRVATFADGRYIITWSTEDTLQDSSGRAVKAQIFAADGSKIGSEFLVNTQTASNQEMPDVTVLADGRFAITWYTINASQDGSSGAIKAQLFDTSGVKLGAEFLVNTVSLGNQYRPEIASLDSGGFAITWVDANAADIKAQIFSATGTKVGTEFLVNNQTSLSQTSQTITTLTNGNIVIAWHEPLAAADGNGSSVALRIFSPTGVPLGLQFVANTAATGHQGSPSVKALTNGNFVVIWSTTDTTQDGNGSALKAQIFSPSGTKLGAEFLVNTSWSGDQERPSVTDAAGGGFLVAWSTSDVTQDGSGLAIKAQVFDAAGTRVGGELRINTLATGDQTVPELATGPNGDVIVTWVSASGDGSGTAIRSQILSANTAPAINSDGGGENGAVNISEGSTGVTTVSATDFGGPTTPIYAISGGVDAGLFAINPTTGSLSFVTAPDYEVPGDADLDNAYEVIVSASDGELSDFQSLTVLVTDVEEFAPRGHPTISTYEMAPSFG